MPSLDNTNNLMVQAINQYVEPIYSWQWIQNPYYTLIDRQMFDPADGLNPQVITTTSGAPQSYMEGFTTLSALSDGTGSSCDVDPITIQSGAIIRNYELDIASWISDVLCLTDLQFDFQAAQQVSNYQKQLKQYATTVWADYYRIKNICMCQNKVVTETTGGGLDIYQNADCDFSDASGDLPSAELEWTHLDYLYDILMQKGASDPDNVVGYSEGQPLITLCCGPGYKRKLWQTDTKVRDTVNWGDAFQNFTARGINTSINGYIPNMDLYPIRYAADGTTKIYPFVNSAATKGTQFTLNPNWLTVARGGQAVYEVAYILPRNVWGIRPRPVGPTSFDMATYNPWNYIGEIQWINNRDMGSNQLGNKGFYRFDIQAAARPIRPEIGVALMTLALD